MNKYIQKIEIGIKNPRVGDIGYVTYVYSEENFSVKYIYHACVECGKKRWVRLIKGKPDSLRCHSCHCTEEVKSKISKSRIERRKRFGYLNSPETRNRISKANMRHVVSEETKVKIGNYFRGIKLSEEQIKKSLCRRTPNSLEKKFQGIIDKYRLPYKFVGDGSFFVKGYNPDFINVNGAKIAIEVYAPYFKTIDGRTVEGWKVNRDKVFNDFGWKVIYFEDRQVTDDCVLNLLGSEIKL